MVTNEDATKPIIRLTMILKVKELHQFVIYLSLVQVFIVHVGSS